MEGDKEFEQFLEEGVPSLESSEFDRHPSEELLSSYVYDRLESTSEARISAHAATCSSCRERVNKLREERKKVEDNMVPLLADPVQQVTEEEQVPFLAQLKGSIEAFLEKTVFPPRRAIYAHVGAYTLVAVLLFGLNKLLDWLLVPPPSPLGSTAQINRWWNHLYWILLPWGLYLLGHGFRVLLTSREGENQEERRNHEQ